MKLDGADVRPDGFAALAVGLLHAAVRLGALDK